MRIFSGVLVAILIFFGAAQECQARFYFTKLGQQVGDLETAFTNPPEEFYQPRTSHPYYDVVITHLCDGAAADLTRKWRSQTGANFLNPAAHFARTDWSRPDFFCATFRQKLGAALQYDTGAVLLGLYAEYPQHQYLFKGDRANRGCLESAELMLLSNAGYK